MDTSEFVDSRGFSLVWVSTLTFGVVSLCKCTNRILVNISSICHWSSVVAEHYSSQLNVWEVWGLNPHTNVRVLATLFLVFK